jgi:hypothetical protein
MPLIPVMVVLSIVGLFIYVVIGAVVATPIVIKMFNAPRDSREYAEKGINANNAPGFFFGTLFWPALLAGFVVFAVFYGPAKIGGKISRYVATAALDRQEAANAA